MVRDSITSHQLILNLGPLARLQVSHDVGVPLAALVAALLAPQLVWVVIHHTPPMSLTAQA